jgi:diphthamide synthase (EF-2-diphthine--ammonia ligase)
MAVEQGARLDALLVASDHGTSESRPTAVPSWIVREHAALLDCPIVSPANRKSQFDEATTKVLDWLREQGVCQVIFSNRRSWLRANGHIEMSAVAKLVARWPLANCPRERIAEEIAARRIKAICVRVNTRFLDASFCGRHVDESFIRDLPGRVDPWGENGEFETCVVDAPLFAGRVALEVNGRQRCQASLRMKTGLCWTALIRRSTWSRHVSPQPLEPLK